MSIETGEEGNEAVNVHLSKEIGQKMVDAMVGQPILTISFSKKGMTITMKPRAIVEVDGEVIPVDPQLLFQRLVILVQKDETLLMKALEHELSSHPATLVGNDSLMLEADKPALGDEIWKGADQNVTLPASATYVIDGGHLLFKARWKKGSSFEEIFTSYENYILKRYGNNAIVVFDGYPDEPDTKDTTHLRRKLSKSGRLVVDQRVVVHVDRITSSVLLTAGPESQKTVILLRTWVPPIAKSRVFSLNWPQYGANRGKIPDFMNWLPKTRT